MNKVSAVKPTFDFVNILRGIAALLVLYFHLQLEILHNYNLHPYQPGTLEHWFVMGVFDLGKFAIGIFFMLSGFLIPATLAKPEASLQAFAIQRFFRLYPAYWVSLLVAVGICWWFELPLRVPPTEALLNVTMLQRFMGAGDVIGAYWTLPIELLFYVSCALLFAGKMLAGRQETMCFILLLGLACAIINFYTGRNLPLALFIGLAVAWLGDILRAYDSGQVSLPNLAISISIVLLALIPICLLGYQAEWPRYVFSYWAAIGLVCLAYCLRHHFSENRLCRTVGAFLSDCSYSFYLLGPPIGLNLGAYVHARYRQSLLTTFVAFAGTLLAAWITYHCVERPSIRLGKWLSKRKPVPGNA